MNNFPRTFFITLQETPLRTSIFLESASKAQVAAVPFYGIFGSRLSLKSKLVNSLECPGREIFMTEGAIGCYLSHLMLWKMLLHFPEDEFLILEDDAIFVENFREKFDVLYDQLPKRWDMVYVGWLPYGEGKRIIKVSDGISILRPSATHAYLIKKSILELACDVIQPCFSPLDLTIATKLLPQIKYYVFDPSLVNQRSYLNTNDSTWNSLVYDWDSDIYGCRKSIIKGLTLSDGWYNLERDDKKMWRWSMDQFSIPVPPSADVIRVICSTPIENVVDIKTDDGNIINYPLSVGDNMLEIPVKKCNLIDFFVKTPFIPSNIDNTSQDNRSLGVCVFGLSIQIGNSDIDINISELSPNSASPLNFKL